MVTLRTNPSFYFTFYLRYLPAFISSNTFTLTRFINHFYNWCFKYHMSRHYVFDVYQPDDTKLYYICIVLKHNKKIVYKTCLLILIFTRLRQKRWIVFWAFVCTWVYMSIILAQSTAQTAGPFSAYEVSLNLSELWWQWQWVVFSYPSNMGIKWKIEKISVQNYMYHITFILLL